jgi:hypothetical protein
LDARLITREEFVSRLRDKGILCLPYAPNQVRLVTHHDISRKDILTTVQAIRETIASR